VPTSITHAGSLPAMLTEDLVIVVIERDKLHFKLKFHTTFNRIALQINSKVYNFSTTPPPTTMCHLENFALCHSSHTHSHLRKQCCIWFLKKTLFSTVMINAVAKSLSI